MSSTFRPQRVLSHARRPGSTPPPAPVPPISRTQRPARAAAPMVPLKAMPRRRGEFPLFSLFSLAFLMACGWLALNAESLRTYMDAHRERDLELERVAALRADIQTLRARYESARHNGLETQAQIRARLDMRRPGERILHIQRPGPKPVHQSELEAGTGIPATRTARPEAMVAAPSPIMSPAVENEPDGLPAPGRSGRSSPPVPSPQAPAVAHDLGLDEPEGLPSPGRR